MKVCFLYFETSKEEWLSKAQDVYIKKVSRFAEFEIVKIKSPSIERDSKDLKIKAEAKQIMDKLQPGDFLVLFDEKGKEFDSIEFSRNLQKVINQSPRRIVFLIGGAFGVSKEVFEKAQQKLSLSKLVFNHHVAIVVALEQIYRAFTIQKGLPYHNQ
jgi:23S rRNA (pseudouridine1915-N3)-methyltransferase